jgi:lactate dehydrogenase-like 2-hydroxyacid dehydrogenase
MSGDERPRVLLMHPILDPGPRLLEEACQVVPFPEGEPLDEPNIRRAAEGCQGIVSQVMDPIGEEVLSTPGLRIVSNVAVGYNNIDVAHARSRGIIVTNTPDVLTDEVADTAMGLLLATVRQLPQADAYLRAGKWLAKPFPFTDTLRGKTMGIVGLGRIGKAIARRAEAFGLSLAYHSRSPKPGVPYPYYPSLVDMAAAVDILMVITPGGAATKHLINAKVLEALGPRGVLINIARGSVVDEKALIAALKAGKLGSAGLDVFEHEPNVPKELIDIPHVVLLPHVGSASVHTRNAMGNLVVDNLKQWFAGKGPITPVVETPWPKPAKG